MRWNGWLSSLATVTATVFIFCGSAHAEDRKYSDLISGTGAPSSFDANGDGVNALYVTFSGRSNLGQVHGGILVEYDFLALGPDPACPAGSLKLPILVSTGNRAVTETDGQLFMTDDAAGGLFCLNPVTGTFTMSVSGNFTGGLGRFAGATGSYHYKGSGQVLAFHPPGSPFGGFVVETAGNIIIPRRP